MARLNLVEPEDMPERFEAEEKVPDELKGGRNVGEERRVQNAETHRSWENNPDVHEFHNNAFLTLWREDVTGLTPRETELVILGVVRSFESKLEWNVHAGTAVDVGVSEDDVVAIFDRSHDELAPKDAALLRYVTALANMNVTDRVHDELSEHYDDGTIVGIMQLAGFYALCALVIDAMGVRTAEPDERFTHLGFDVLAARSEGLR